jgi:hypothetical protein
MCALLKHPSIRHKESTKNAIILRVHTPKGSFLKTGTLRMFEISAPDLYINPTASSL